MALIGALVVWPVVVPQIFAALDASDFYTPRHQRFYCAVRAMHDRGDPIEVTPVMDELRKLGEKEVAWVVSAAAHGERNVVGAIRIVAEMSLRRRLLTEALELSSAAQDLKLDPSDALDTARSALASIDNPLSAAQSDDEDFDEFLSRTPEKPEWLVHGLLREKWRTVIVANPGEGKTILLRQIAVCAAYGIRPLRQDLGPVRPISTLVLDLENTDDHLHYSFDMLTRQAKCTVGASAAGAKRLWRRPGGINLRARADRGAIEKMLVRHRPELLVLGPLYKAYRVAGSDSWDLVAREVQSVLDDWRERYGLAMVIEDHAPHGSVLRPFGSSLWERWPEIGIGMESERDGRRLLSRWRGDRMPTDWPDALARGRPWPWQGIWDRGLPTESSEELIDP